MGFSKFIVTHETEYGVAGSGKFARYSNAYLLPDHYCHSFASFRELVEEAKKSFPELRDEDIECRTVAVSGWCRRQPCLFFPLPADTQCEGWFNVNKHAPDIVLA